ncbi:MAG: right-handed parallel beta-helix repeat-containing protein [Cytophagaceae bacterium]
MKTFLYCLIAFSIATSVYARPGKKHIIPLSQNYADAAKLNIRPGDTIAIQAGKREFFQLKNFYGDSLNPLVIINEGGQVVIGSVSHYYGFRLANCRYFKLTGTGDAKVAYGFKISGTKKGINGISVDHGSSDFEIEYVEVTKTGFAAIIAKTDPDCEGRFVRDSFLMKNVAIHHNYIHDVSGEGFYIGNSFYGGWDKNQRCKGNVLKPHEIHGLKVYENKLENIGWDGIQVGCATKDVFVYDNEIMNYGLEGRESHGNGIQIGDGTTGVVYNNRIINGAENGIIALGLGENFFFNNLIINPGTNGFFCDSRITKEGSEIAFVNNTIIGPGNHGFMIYNRVSRNVLVNNLVVRNNKKAFIHKHGEAVDLQENNNLLSEDKKEISIGLTANYSYSVGKSSPAYQKGKPITEFWKKYNCHKVFPEPEILHIGYNIQ